VREAALAHAGKRQARRAAAAKLAAE